jgi:chaperonin GroES
MSEVLQVLGEQVLLRRQPEKGASAGGIIIPEQAKQKSTTAEVLAVGLGKRLDNGTRAAPEVRQGQVVVVSKYAGTEIDHDGEKYLLVREPEILAIVGGA